MPAPGLLLVDIGNTRVKWRYAAAGRWGPENARGNALRARTVKTAGEPAGTLEADLSAKLADDWRRLDFDRVQIANVAGESGLDRVVAAVRSARAAAPTDVRTGKEICEDRGPHPGPLPAGEAATARSADIGADIAVLMASPEQCGVVNCYREPGRLGADRWAALIGARALELAARANGAPPASSMIVSLGTATTIDVLAADGRFIGGVILPGFATMRSALALNTAELPHAGGQNEFLLPMLADNTEDAIAAGILHAQLGAVERIRHQIPGPRTRCLLCGGDAARIAPLLSFDARIEPDLVLRGLYEVARARSAEDLSDGSPEDSPHAPETHADAPT